MDYEFISRINANGIRSLCERIKPKPFRPRLPVRFKIQWRTAGVKDFYFDFSKSPRDVFATTKIFIRSFFHWFKVILSIFIVIFKDSMKESSIGSFMRTHYVRNANVMRRLSFILFLLFTLFYLFKRIY